MAQSILDRIMILASVLPVTLAGAAGALAAPVASQRTVEVEHITVVSTKTFGETEAALEKSIPQLDPSIAEALRNGDAARAKELEHGAPLFIFLKRDHGSLLRVNGRPAKALQYEIGNPLTASRMTAHELPAALYAPLRLVLYEKDGGGAIFEYDKPSTLFGQFGDQQVAAVGRELDAEMEEALRRAAE